MIAITLVFVAWLSASIVSGLRIGRHLRYLDSPAAAEAPHAPDPQDLARKAQH